MTQNTAPEGAGIHGLWTTRWAFILATAGSAIGLGNIWKFPYITGVYGGGAFVATYILCVIFIGMPIMVAEIMMGRRGRAAPINAMATLAQESGLSRRWAWLGWMGTLAGFLILSFYSMIAGWAVYYTVLSAQDVFAAATADSVRAQFDGMLASPATMLLWHTVFMAMTIFIVARGVQAGLERAVRWMMPALFVLLFTLLGYAVTTGHFMQGVSFMFDFDFSKLTAQGVIVAMGHAFFTLSLGMGAVMAYGAYMPRNQSIGEAVLAVGALNTVFAILMGLAIFPIVFANGLEANQGPGMMFVTLPVAFGNLPLGSLFATLFFALVVLAAWTSAISIAEPFVAWAVEKGMKRAVAAAIIGVTSWAIGILCLLSFNVLSGDEYKLFGKTVFDGLDFLTTNLMLPIGGVLIAIFAGWAMKETKAMKELAMQSQVIYIAWRIGVRIVAPAAVLVVLLNFFGVFGS